MFGANAAGTCSGNSGRDRKKPNGSIGFFGGRGLSLHFRPPNINSSNHQINPASPGVTSPLGPSYQPSRETPHQKFARKVLEIPWLFNFSVLAPLAGAILLFIGLIQLTPGADASPYAAPLITAGTIAIVLGLFVIAIRMFFVWELKKLNSMRADVPQIKVNEPSYTDDPEKGPVGGTTPDPSGANGTDNVGNPKPPVSRNPTPAASPRKEQVSINMMTNIDKSQDQDETSRLLGENEITDGKIMNSMNNISNGPSSSPLNETAPT